MTPATHHELCLGVLAEAYHKLDDPYVKAAIHEAVLSAAEMGIPVSVDRLLSREPIASVGRQLAHAMIYQLHINQPPPAL